MSRYLKLTCSNHRQLGNPRALDRRHGSRHFAAVHTIISLQLHPHIGVLGLGRLQVEFQQVRLVAVASCRFVVSGLAPRWAAKRPQLESSGVPGISRWQVLGLLRSPTRGKPTRHKKLARHDRRSQRAFTVGCLRTNLAIDAASSAPPRPNHCGHTAPAVRPAPLANRCPPRVPHARPVPPAAAAG